MARKRYTEEQIIPILKRHEAGTATQELCREAGALARLRFTSGKPNTADWSYQMPDA